MRLKALNTVSLSALKYEAVNTQSIRLITLSNHRFKHGSF